MARRPKKAEEKVVPDPDTRGAAKPTNQWLAYAADLLRALRTLLPFVSTDIARENLSSLLLEDDGEGRLRLSATDGHMAFRMTVPLLEVPESAPRLHLAIRREAAEELVGHLILSMKGRRHEAGTLEAALLPPLASDPGTVVARVGTSHVPLRLSGSPFPDLDLILPKHVLLRSWAGCVAFNAEYMSRIMAAFRLSLAEKVDTLEVALQAEGPADPVYVFAPRSTLRGVLMPMRYDRDAPPRGALPVS